MLLKWGMKALSRTSPLALIAGGVIVALSVPCVKRGLRSAAVTATASMLSISENLREGVGSIIAEAKTAASSAASECLEGNNTEAGSESPGL